MAKMCKKNSLKKSCLPSSDSSTFYLSLPAMPTSLSLRQLVSLDIYNPIHSCIAQYGHEINFGSNRSPITDHRSPITDAFPSFSLGYALCYLNTLYFMIKILLKIKAFFYKSYFKFIFNFPAFHFTENLNLFQSC